MNIIFLAQVGQITPTEMERWIERDVPKAARPLFYIEHNRSQER